MLAFVILEDVIADASHRAHFIKKAVPSWDHYYAPTEILKDKVIPDAVRVVNELYRVGADVHFLVDRPELAFEATVRWLNEVAKFDVADGRIIMRPQSNLLDPKEFRRQQVLTASDSANRQRGRIFLAHTQEDCDTFAEFGPVLKSPECFPQLFPVKPPEE